MKTIPALKLELIFLLNMDLYAIRKNVDARKNAKYFVLRPRAPMQIIENKIIRFLS
ncbi:hypothetical protein D3C85_1764480 [compost metagenome]